MVFYRDRQTYRMYDKNQKSSLNKAKELSENSQLLVIRKPEYSSQHLIQWLIEGRYTCTIVYSESEAERLLELWAFDALVCCDKNWIVIRPLRYDNHPFLYAN